MLKQRAQRRYVGISQQQRNKIFTSETTLLFHLS